MSAKIIDGRAIASRVRAQVRDEVQSLRAGGAPAPGLATLLIGDDPASAVYIASKRRACAEAGIVDRHQRLPADASQAKVAELIGALNADRQVSGILLQLPVPEHLPGAELTALIDPLKDVDGLTPLSAGRLAQNTAGLRPCTPLGVLELLDAQAAPLEGAEAVIVGRSDLVGKPLAALLLARNATVTVCHSRTRGLEEVCRRADILIAAVGVPRLLGADHVKPGATVIDVGMNRTSAGLCGDVDFDAVLPRAGLITPVPGGVGPMTIAMLLRNTLTAAGLQRSSAPEPSP